MKNFFQVLQLPEQFDLDAGALEMNYLVAQKQTHPDNFVHLSSSEQIQALQKSADVNDAYAALKSDVKRSVHLLELLGCGNVLAVKDIPMDLLQAQFEWRERAEEENPLDVLKALKKQEKSTKIELKDSFENKSLEVAKKLTLTLHFLKKLEKELKRKK